MGQSRNLKRCLLGAAAVSVFAGAAAGTAMAEDPAASEVRTVRIEAGPLADALRAFSAQSGVAVMFSERQVSGLNVRETAGTDEPEALLRRLLEGSGLEAVKGQGGAYVLRPTAPASDGTVPARGPETPAAPERIEVPGGGDAVPELRAQTVIVTGTSLRGLAPESSPLQVYSREEILGSGGTSTEQFLRTLPQNFGGGSSEFFPRGARDDISSRLNATYGTGSNLRGLGSGATLTLVNGGRLAPSSSVGDFVDLSMIPMTAIERVEVLSDGASSIYGGDAVAGVVNLVLRDDFKGAETALRYGTVTDGGLGEVRLSQTVGGAWRGGSLMATYEYFERDPLPLSDRPGISPPTFQNGAPIADTDISLINLLPGQKRDSLVLSGRQALGQRLHVSGTALFSNRQASTSSVGIGSTLSAVGSTVDSEAATANLVADFELNDRISFSLDGSYSEVRSNLVTRGIRPVAGTQSQSSTDSSLWSIGFLANADLLELPAGPVRAAIGGQFRKEDLLAASAGFPPTRDGSREVSAAFAEVHLPLVGEGNAAWGVRRLELNLSGRIDDYSDFGRTTNPKIGVLWSPTEALRIRSSYGTSFAPPKLGYAGALDRVVTVTRYDFLRSVLNIPLPDPLLAGVNIISVSGTAADLGPETSESFTTGFDFSHAAGAHDFTVSGTYSDIRFEDRLGTLPIPGNLNPNFAPNLVLSDPGLFPAGTVIFFPSDAQIASVLEARSRPVQFSGGATAVENIGFINNVFLTQNLASTQTRGLDLQVSYGLDADVGRLTARLNASYILDFTKKASRSTPTVETLNTLYNPVDLKLRGQLGLSRGGFSGSLFLNYIDSYQTNSTASAREIDAWSTFDLALSYRFGDSAPGWLDRMTISLSALNLFDRSPPAVPPDGNFGIAGYDPANASPLGRFMAIDVRKAF